MSMGVKVVVLERGATPAPVNSASYASHGSLARLQTQLSSKLWFSALRSMLMSALPESLRPTDEDIYFRVRPRALFDLHFWRFAFDVSYAALFQSSQQKTLHDELLNFTAEAVDVMLESLAHVPETDAFIEREVGLYKLLRTAPIAHIVSDGATKPVDNCLEHDVSVLGADEFAALEPSLAHLKTNHAKGGAIFMPHHARASLAGLTRAITEEIGIPIVTDVTITDLIAENGGGMVSQIATSRGLITVDSDTDVMLCTGAQTADLLRLLGYYVPLVGLKGYALRVPLTPAQASRLPTKTIVDGHLYASVMANSLVCSSGGEFDNGDVVVRPEPVRALRDDAKKLFPSVPAGAIDAGQVVAGYRPLTANFGFLVGRIANDSNVFVSTGQGFHGAKLSLGCAVLAARAVVGAQSLTSLPIDHFLALHHIKHAPLFCRWARALTIN